MTFHCHTGEMKQARQSEPINNSCISYREEVSAARALDPRLTVGERCKTEQQLLNMLQHFPETACLARRPEEVERGGRGETGSALEVSHKRKGELLPSGAVKPTEYRTQLSLMCV